MIGLGKQWKMHTQQARILSLSKRLGELRLGRRSKNKDL